MKFHSCDLGFRYGSGYKCFDLHGRITPIGLDKTHPKQVKCFNEKKHKNRSQTFILHYGTREVVKDKKYVLVHAVECIITTLAKLVFKILAFTFLN